LSARCSAHRTGTAVDLYVGAAPGHLPVDSDNANRLHLSKTPAYRWLVQNAARYGFVNYVFEPWHWEWVGAPASENKVFADRAAYPNKPSAREVDGHTAQLQRASMLGGEHFELATLLRALFAKAEK